MSKLTTHVLDTAHGKPGAGIRVHLFRVRDGAREPLGTFTTNSDGRCDTPLLQGDAFQVGVYELDFHAGDYFAKLGARTTEPRFVDVVTLRFGIGDAWHHYHVPLLVSPWSYSTYRGS